MLCKLGTYEIPHGRCEIARRDTPEFNEAQQLLSNTVRLDCSAALYSDSAANMDKAVKLLLAAFRIERQDFLVLLPGGSQRSQLSLLNAGSIGGVRVVQPPTFESIKNAGYVTWLPYSFSLEAEYPAALSGFLYRDYTETITFRQPVRREAWLLVLHGAHQKQQIRERPFYAATQSGRAVGYLARPSAPRPIWPSAWMNRDQIDLTITSPRPRGDNYVDFETTWSFEYESDRPLLGYPNAWPI